MAVLHVSAFHETHDASGSALGKADMGFDRDIAECGIHRIAGNHALLARLSGIGVAVYPESADFCSVNVAEKSGRTPCGYGREVGKGITAAVIFALAGFGLDGTDGLQVHQVHVNVGDLSVRLVQETGGFRTVAKLRKADKVAGGLYQERLGIGTLSLEGGKAVFYRDAGHVYRKPGYDAGLEFLAGGNGDFPGQASALDGNGDLEGGAGNIRGTAGKKDVFGPVRIDGDDIAFAFGRGGGRGRMIHPAAGNAQALVEGKRDGADGLSSRVKVAEGKQTVGGKVIESQADRRRNIRRHGGNTHRNDGGRIHGGGRRSLGSGNRVLDIILVRGIVTATGERAGGRENKELIGSRRPGRDFGQERSRFASVCYGNGIFLPFRDGLYVF